MRQSAGTRLPPSSAARLSCAAHSTSMPKARPVSGAQQTMLQRQAEGGSDGQQRGEADQPGEASSSQAATSARTWLKLG